MRLNKSPANYAVRLKQSAKPSVRLLSRGLNYEAWVFEGNAAVRCCARVNQKLARDAERLGQDFVGDMIDDALRDIERRAQAA